MFTLMACLAVLTPASRVEDPPAPAPNWAGDADPPAEKVEWPAKPTPVAVKVDTHPTAVFSDPGQRFVALRAGVTPKPTVTVYDLTTGHPVGELPDTLLVAPPYALSGDGLRFAAGKPVTRNGPVFVYDVQTGKLIREIATPAKPARVAFLSADRLICLFEREVAAYSAMTGERLWQVALTVPLGQSSVSGRLLAISPGRRFVAVFDGAAVRLLKADTGAPAGTLPIVIPQAERAKPTGSRAEALTFAPDGSRLVALVATPAGHRTYTWDLRTGREVGYVPVPYPSALGADLLTWSADGTTWLYDNDRLVDPQTGKVLWRVPRNTSNTNVRVLVGPHLLLDFDPSSPTGRVPAAPRFEPVALPKDRVEATRAAVRAGGVWVEGGLPKAIEVRPGPDPHRLPDAGAGVWRGVPDPAPDLPIPAAPVPLPGVPGDIASVHIGRAAVVDLAPRKNFQFDLTRSRTLVRVDLGSGAETGRLELPPGVGLLAIDRAAARAVSIDVEEGRRLDVWSLDTGKHVAGWRPDPLRSDDRARVLLAEFVAADRVLTVTAGGQAALWQLPAVEPIWRRTLERFDGRRVTPGGKYLVGVQDRFVRFIDVATGESAGDVRLPIAPTVSDELDRPGYINSSATRVAVRPDGREAVALVAPPLGPTTAVRVDLATGKSAAVRVDRSQAVVRSSASGAEWDPPAYAGPDHVLTMTGVLDLRLGQQLATVDARSQVLPVVAHPRSGHLVWHVQSRQGAGGDALMLVATDLGPTLAGVARRADSPDALLGPGTRVSVAVRGEGVGREEGEKAVRDAVAKLAAERGWVVVEGADVVVRVSAQEVEAKGVQPIRVTAVVNAKGKPPEQLEAKVAPVDVQAKLTVEVRGQVVWSGTPAAVSWRTAPTRLTVSDKEADLTQAHRAKLWATLPQSLRLELIPQRLIRTADGYEPLPARIRLTADGVVPSGTPPARP